MELLNITMFLQWMMCSANAEFATKKEELNKYLAERTSYWEDKSKRYPRFKLLADEKIANATQYVERELVAAEKRHNAKDAAAKRLVETQMKATKAKMMRRQCVVDEVEVDLGVLDEFLAFHPNDERIQRHRQTISETEYDRIEKRRDALTNKFAIKRHEDKSRKTERNNSRCLKYTLQ
jgi:hypothetical protein